MVWRNKSSANDRVDKDEVENEIEKGVKQPQQQVFERNFLKWLRRKKYSNN